MNSSDHSLLSFSSLHFLCKSLICQYLFFLKHFSRKTYLNLNLSLLIYDSIFRLAVVDEELLIIYQYCFSFFDVAHEPTEEIRIQIILFQMIKSNILIWDHLVHSLICLPDRSDSEYLNLLWSWRINLNLAAIRNFTKEGSWILYIKFIFINFNYLIFMDEHIHMLLKVRSDSILHKSSSWLIKSPQWYQINSL